MVRTETKKKYRYHKKLNRQKKKQPNFIIFYCNEAKKKV